MLLSSQVPRIVLTLCYDSDSPLIINVVLSSSQTPRIVDVLVLYLQAPDNVKLKIYANSTRRSLWNAKLGYQPCSRPPIVSLSSLFSDGGPVPGIDVIITRVYPLQVVNAINSPLIVPLSSSCSKMSMCVELV